MTAGYHRARFEDFVLAAPQDVGQRFQRERIFGPSNHIQDRYRCAAHGVAIGQRIRRGDLTEGERIVNDRREKIDRLDQRQLVVYLDDACIVGGVGADQQSWIVYRRQSLQDFAQLRRAQLRRSTSARNRGGQPDDLIFCKIHLFVSDTKLRYNALN